MIAVANYFGKTEEAAQIKCYGGGTAHGYGWGFFPNSALVCILKLEQGWLSQSIGVKTHFKRKELFIIWVGAVRHSLLLIRVIKYIYKQNKRTPQTCC